MAQKILLTGGSGLLGKEILKLDGSLIAPSHEEMDIADFGQVLSVFQKNKPYIVLHCAAATKPPEHEKNPELGITANIIGTANVARACIRLGIRMVYACTDYLYVGSGPHKETEPVMPPYNFGWSKLGGEAAVHMVPNFLVLRLSFGPVPFPWEKVYEGQWNSKLYVDEMAPLVLAAAKSSATGIMNIGGPRMTLEAYAKRTRSGIQTIPKPDWVPGDTSLDLTRMKAALDISDESKLLKH
ncbi:MAG: sugar nucleotide-binding protein [Candidatus Liptonbacteria bacterium]|nr:sugar nucleotide-binding protein [Candidatus Liptonbacteria bacterium]